MSEAEKTAFFKELVFKAGRSSIGSMVDADDTLTPDKKWDENTTKELNVCLTYVRATDGIYEYSLN